MPIDIPKSKMAKCRPNIDALASGSSASVAAALLIDESASTMVIPEVDEDEDILVASAEDAIPQAFDFLGRARISVAIEPAAARPPARSRKQAKRLVRDQLYERIRRPLAAKTQARYTIRVAAYMVAGAWLTSMRVSRPSRC